MELLESARRLGEFPTRFVLWRAVRDRDRRILDLYIDALEDYVAVLAEVCDTISALIRTLHRAQHSLARQQRIWQSNVQRFREEGKDDLSHMARHRVLTMNYLAATYERLLNAKKEELAAYREVRLLLEATLAESRQRREEIEAWLEGRSTDMSLPEFARPIPHWDEARLSQELTEILGLTITHPGR